MTDTDAESGSSTHKDGERLFVAGARVAGAV